MTRPSIPDQFEERVRETPDAIAVVAGGVRLTYRELAGRANQLSHRLLDLDVGAEEPVAVLLERSVEVVVAFLGVARAGACYLPLHGAYPVERQQWIVESSGSRILVADRTTSGGQLTVAEPILIDTDPTLRTLPVAQPGVVVDPDQLAYVMFTSGSAGEPKGVAVPHRCVVELSRDRCWDTGRHRRVPLVAPHAFDASTYEIWVPLLRGGTVVVPPRGHLDAGLLRRTIERERVTAVHLTAGLFRMVAEAAPDCLAGVAEVMTGGDVVSPVAVSRVLDACPGTVVRALYGPTEATVFATNVEIAPPYQPDRTVPIGQPMDRLRAYVLDEDLRPVPAGTAGELFLAGDRLARGYLGRPDLTAERFVADPFSGSGERMYRTGDLVRANSDGLLEFLGRADEQVKVLGFRVELAEVEAVLAEYPGLADVAVAANVAPGGERRLTGYVVPADGPVDVASVLAHVRESLPEYMVPAAVAVLDALPLTPNGKLDRAALPVPEPGSAATYRPPRTPTETLVCAVFAETLGVPRVGVDDNFFELGGQSLEGMRLTLRIEVQTGLQLPIAELFDAPTPALYAERLDVMPRPARPVQRR